MREITQPVLMAQGRAWRDSGLVSDSFEQYRGGMLPLRFDGGVRVLSFILRPDVAQEKPDDPACGQSWQPCGTKPFDHLGHRVAETRLKLMRDPCG